MQLIPREIILLKPTPVFLSFLRTYLPKRLLPNLSLLHIDTTAYTLPLHETEEALLDTLEANFRFMFQYEIRRWLGNEALLSINASFLDFLCCFKFEMHSHIVLLEPSFQDGQQLLRIKPRTLLFRAIKHRQFEANEEENTTLLEEISLSHLTENATVIIKNFSAIKEIPSFLKQYFRPIFKMEMMRVSNSRECWPAVQSFEAFNYYFLIDIHTHLIHLENEHS